MHVILEAIRAGLGLVGSGWFGSWPETRVEQVLVGRILLCCAIFFSDLLDREDLHGNTVLHYAVQCDHQKGKTGVELTRKLIEKGAGTYM